MKRKERKGRGEKEREGKGREGEGRDFEYSAETKTLSEQLCWNLYYLQKLSLNI